MKRMNFPRRKDKRRDEAKARQEVYKPDPAKFGLRQKVKADKAGKWTESGCQGLLEVMNGGNKKATKWFDNYFKRNK